jgi:hypothetical protein
MGKPNMTNEALNIREYNKRAHLDIEKDIQTQKNGLFTFTLRVNGGNIVDYSVTEYVGPAKYLKLRAVTYQELSISRGD